MFLPKLTLLALVAMLVFLPQVPASPRLSVHTQSFSQTIPGQQFGSNFPFSTLLTFNLTGHDPGSDRLLLIFNQNSRLTTNGFPAIIIGLNSTQNTFCMTNNCYQLVTSGSFTFVPQFVVSCGSVGSNSQSVTCPQTIYVPLNESQLYILFFTATSGDAASLVQGTHTWTVTTIS
jgi:hypothetical protein